MLGLIFVGIAQGQAAGRRDLNCQQTPIGGSSTGPLIDHGANPEILYYIERFDISAWVYTLYQYSVTMRLSGIMSLSNFNLSRIFKKGISTRS